ncbi:hypothetical protein ACFR9U_07110 [Halorientalis brevis]|uniref:Tat pathway signal sequence domain protein n=1 Tax=Halorientalis brevis TaxID=1126241 RepID=A0ABD6CBE9_9EURY|nr:hypothetical protein [Halorientalis brevis]
MALHSRREFVALFGTAAATGVAGCSRQETDQHPETGQPTEHATTGQTTAPTEPAADAMTTDSASTTSAEQPPTVASVPIGETIEYRDARLTVANPRVRRCVMARTGPSRFLGVHDGQYVVVDVTVDGTLDADRWTFGLRGSAGGSFVSTDESHFLVESMLEDDSLRMDPSTWTERPVAVPFPARYLPAASVQWRHDDGETVETRGEWELDTETRRALTHAPQFTLKRYEVQRTDGGVRLDVVVENVGVSDGRFLARALPGPNIADVSAVIELDVPAGETARYRDVPSLFEQWLDSVEIGNVTLEYPERGQRTRVHRELPESTGTRTSKE